MPCLPTSFHAEITNHAQLDRLNQPTPARQQQEKQITQTEHDIMKYQNYALFALAALFTVSCNKEKAAIEKSKDATQNAIDLRKDEVNADAKLATEKTEAKAAIAKAQILADKESEQVQLDAEKKKAEAQADAAKAKVDQEN